MRKKNLLIISAALLVILACNIGSQTPPTEIPNNNNSIATSVALTLEASGQIPPSAELPTPLPTMTQEIPPTITLTPTIALSATPSVPMASVSENTNCRTGPGKAYDYIGALTKGEEAEVVGKNTSNDYWIIKNPDANGTCWLWGYYATIAGNTSNLQEYAVPPTPTPEPPVAPSNFIAAKTCVAGAPPDYDLTVDLIWLDNSDNENGFYIYLDGAIIFGVAIDQTQTDVNLPVTDGVPVVFGISAFNVTGESAIQTVQVVCP